MLVRGFRREGGRGGGRPFLGREEQGERWMLYVNTFFGLWSGME